MYEVETRWTVIWENPDGSERYDFCDSEQEVRRLVAYLVNIDGVHPGYNDILVFPPQTNHLISEFLD